MKNLLFGLSVCFATVLSAQNYPNNGWGNEGSNNGYGNYNNENSYFPDDYYYDYPSDYYPDDYYQGYYSDYQQSLQMINWKRFFRENNLNRRQISMILDLNNQFNSYNVWNSYYSSNPQRWYYDRYYALERILGPSVYIVFQNRYYEGYNPVNYYHSRWENYYRPNYYVRPAYANININLYKVNRQQYHQSVGTNYGWKQARNVSNGFVESGNTNGNYRNDTTSGNGFTNSRSGSNSTNTSTRNSTTRNNNTLQTSPQQPRTRSSSAATNTVSQSQSTATRSVRTAEPRRSNSVSSSPNTSVNAQRNTSTRSSGNTQSRPSNSSQRSSSTGSRGATGGRR